MKKHLIAALLLCASTLIGAGKATVCDDCDCEVTGKSFFSVRPPWQASSPERLTMFRDAMDARVDGYHGAFQVALFGGRTTRPTRLAKYFFPDCKERLLVTEEQREDTDILAAHFNIYTANENFESLIEIRPNQSFVGVGLNYRQQFAERCDGRGFFFEVSLPIEHVRNEMNLCEQVIEDGGGVDGCPGTSVSTVSCNPCCPVTTLDCVLSCSNAQPNMISAFAQECFKFGRIENGCCPTDCNSNSSCNTTKTSVAGAELRLGYQILDCENYNWDGWFGVVLPSGNTPKGIRVFEPIVGYNNHWGIETGTSFDVVFWEHDCEDRNFVFAFDCHGLYLFNKTEVRSFDLKNKPWSRYMQMYASKEQAQEAANSADPNTQLRLGVPGINVLTQCVRVKPHFSRTFNWGFIYNHCQFRGELGYNFYAREAECVELECPWVEGPALKCIFTGAGQTDSVQQIGNRFGNLNCKSVNDYDQNIITAEDLDLNTAAAPCTLSHTIYGSMGYHWDERCYPTFVGLGGSYEIVTNNTSVNRWMAWAKFGLSF